MLLNDWLHLLFFHKDCRPSSRRPSATYQHLSQPLLTTMSILAPASTDVEIGEEVSNKEEKQSELVELKEFKKKKKMEEAKAKQAEDERKEKERAKQKR